MPNAFDISKWNNPNFLNDVGASDGWYSLWCRLCSNRGDKVSKVLLHLTPKGIRDPYICDKCKDKESITNEEVTL